MGKKRNFVGHGEPIEFKKLLEASRNDRPILGECCRKRAKLRASLFTLLTLVPANPRMMLILVDVLKKSGWTNGDIMLATGDQCICYDSPQPELMRQLYANLSKKRGEFEGDLDKFLELAEAEAQKLLKDKGIEIPEDPKSE